MKNPPTHGQKLEHLSWLDAEAILNEKSVVVIPLGAQLKEHGPHLPLNNDWLMANYFAEKILQLHPIVLTPPINFNYFPAMVDYPGTVSLSESTSSKLVEEIVFSLAKFGPKNFYILNTGISTIKVLKSVKTILSSKEIHMTFADFGKFLEPIKKQLEEQEGGTHADEIETSIMLSITPDSVHMDKAQKDYHGNNLGPLRRKKGLNGVYSPTGSWGDPTLATREKGDKLVSAILENLNKDIQNIFDQLD